MSSIPKTLRYSKTHEWVRKEEEGYTVGITDHAQSMLGDLVYVELPEPDAHFESGQECAVVESVKAAADIYCPLAGEVLEVNEAVIENPQLVNEDPYGKGWLFKLRPFESDINELLNPEEYLQQVASEAH
jgi:glycine cleavage system H protein